MNHAEVGAAAAVLLSPAAVWLIRLRLWRARLLRRSPGRMALPPGSFMPALRVGSGRGPTLRTALRGATSERVEHATGSTCPGRPITRIIEYRNERALRSPPPTFRPNWPRTFGRFLGKRRRTRHPQDRALEESRKCLILFGLARFDVEALWTAKCRGNSGQCASDTRCGNVDQHRHTDVHGAAAPLSSPGRPRCTGRKDRFLRVRRGTRPRSPQTSPR